MTKITLKKNLYFVSGGMLKLNEPKGNVISGAMALEGWNPNELTRALYINNELVLANATSKIDLSGPVRVYYPSSEDLIKYVNQGMQQNQGVLEKFPYLDLKLPTNK